MGKREETRKQRRLSILKAARAQLAQRPYAQVELTKIAAAAGVTRQQIHDLYPDKAALYRDLYKIRLVRWAPLFAEAVIAEEPDAFVRFAKDTLAHQHTLLRLASVYEAELMADGGVVRNQTNQAIIQAIADAGWTIDHALVKARIGTGIALLEMTLAALSHAYQAQRLDIVVRKLNQPYYFTLTKRMLTQLNQTVAALHSKTRPKGQ